MDSPPFSLGEVARLLAAMPEAVRIELGALPAALLAWHPAPGAWCVKEVLGHLLEAERRGFAGRIRLILDHAEPALSAWDQANVAQDRRDCGRDAAELLRELTEARQESVALVSGLTHADLGRGGRHPQVGRLRVGDLLHEWVHHDRNHLRQILTAVQASAWPHMGNAQRFSDP